MIRVLARLISVFQGWGFSSFLSFSFPFGCLDVTADTHKLFVHVAPVVGGLYFGLGVGEVPFLFDGLDDDVLPFLDWVKGLVFLEVRVVTVATCWCR